MKDSITQVNQLRKTTYINQMSNAYTTLCLSVTKTELKWPEVFVK